MGRSPCASCQMIIQSEAARVGFSVTDRRIFQCPTESLAYQAEGPPDEHGEEAERMSCRRVMGTSIEYNFREIHGRVDLVIMANKRNMPHVLIRKLLFNCRSHKAIPQSVCNRVNHEWLGIKKCSSINPGLSAGTIYRVRKTRGIPEGIWRGRSKILSELYEVSANRKPRFDLILGSLRFFCLFCRWERAGTDVAAAARTIRPFRAIDELAYMYLGRMYDITMAAQVAYASSATSRKP